MDREDWWGAVHSVAKESDTTGATSVQFSHSVLSDSLQPMDYSISGFPVHHQLLEFAQIHAH